MGKRVSSSLSIISTAVTPVATFKNKKRPALTGLSPIIQLHSRRLGRFYLSSPTTARQGRALHEYGVRPPTIEVYTCPDSATHTRS